MKAKKNNVNPLTQLKRELMQIIIDHIQKNQMTQTHAAKLLRTTQPRISNLLNKKTHLFSLDLLVDMIHKLNKKVSFCNHDIDCTVSHGKKNKQNDMGCCCY